MQTLSETQLEKLDPPTSVQGLSAELAKVTRFYKRDFDTGVSEEYGTPGVEVLWGVTAQDKVAQLEKEKLAIAEKAIKDAAKIDASIQK